MKQGKFETNPYFKHARAAIREGQKELESKVRQNKKVIFDCLPIVQRSPDEIRSTLLGILLNREDGI